jgi:hypothetical protein
MNPMELGMMIMASTTDPSASSRAFAIDELGIPEEVNGILVARKLPGLGVREIRYVEEWGHPSGREERPWHLRLTL